MGASASKTSKPKTTTSTLKKNQKFQTTDVGPGAGRGGAGRGQGRKPGIKNRVTRELQAAVAAAGETPLEFMLKIMRGEACPADASPAEKAAYAALRFEAAKASAPYVHSRLSSVEMAATVAGKDAKAAKVPSDPIDASKAYKDLMG